MAITVGITGGIGSGKSTICDIFKLLGTPVFEADVEAKKLMISSHEIKTGLIDLFGDNIYTLNDTLDRKKLAGIIFNDEVQLNIVNELVHPVVHSEFENWKQKQTAPYIIHEAAILFESGFYKMMDFTVLISAPEDMRIERVTKRDGATAEQVKERINKQWSDDKKKKLADRVIYNDNKKLIIPQIVSIDKQLKEYGKIW